MRPSGLNCGSLAQRRDLYFKIPGQHRDHDAEAYERGWYWGLDHEGIVSAVIPPDDLKDRHFMIGYGDWLLRSQVSGRAGI